MTMIMIMIIIIIIMIIISIMITHHSMCYVIMYGINMRWMPYVGIMIYEIYTYRKRDRVKERERSAREGQG